MPALLEERGQEVEGHGDVRLEVFVRHVNAADGGGEAGDLLSHKHRSGWVGGPALGKVGLGCIGLE